MKSATQHGYIPLPYVSGGHAEIGPYSSPSCLGLSVASLGTSRVRITLYRVRHPMSTLM